MFKKKLVSQQNISFGTNSQGGFGATLTDVIYPAGILFIDFETIFFFPSCAEAAAMIGVVILL